MMQRLLRAVPCALVVCLFPLLATLSAFASGHRGKDSPGQPASDSPPSATAAIEETLERQTMALKQLQDTVATQEEMLRKQQSQIEQQQSQIESLVHALAPAGTAADTGRQAGAGKPAPDDALQQTEPKAQTGNGQAPSSLDTHGPSQTEDILRSDLAELNQRLGKFTLTGDIRFRFQANLHRGLDEEVASRSTFPLKIRLRLQLGEKFNDHFDWAVRFTSGDSDTSGENVRLDDFFARKPVSIERAYIHYDVGSKPVDFEVYAGKIPFPWELSSLNFESSLKPEGLAEIATIQRPEDSKLQAVRISTWQLPFQRRNGTSDAYIYGVQLATDWEWSENWATTIWGEFFNFHKFSLADLTPDGLPVASPTLLAPNPAARTVDDQSDFGLTSQRQVAVIAETAYSGWGAKGDDDESKWQLTLRPEWVHNLNALSDQRDGYVFQVDVGRQEEKGDLLFEDTWFRSEEEVFPAFFVSPDGIDTNLTGHQLMASYLLDTHVRFRTRYFLVRRINPQGPVNRTLNRAQFDVTYIF